MNLPDFNEAYTIDKKTGRLFWKKVSKYHIEKLGKEVGNPMKSRGDKYYWVVSLDGRKYKRSQVVYYMVNGVWPRPLVDHINGDSLDDRPENLRQADHSLNSRNHQRVNIRPIKKTGRFQVRLGDLHLGNYGTKEEALEVYKTERAKQWQT